MCITAVVSTIGPDNHHATPERARGRDVLKPQEHHYMHRYLTAAEWDRLRNSSLSIASKIDLLVNRCKAIGLLSLTERTATALSSVLIVAHGQACNTKIDIFILTLQY